MSGVTRIASAPVSYGVFGGADTSQLAVQPAELLAAMAAAGYTGSELGPPGFFGDPEQTAAAFEAAAMSVVGAYVPLHLSASDEQMAADLEAMRRTLDELAASGTAEALAILADEGDDELIRHPFRAADDRSRGLSSEQWELAAERVDAAAVLAQSFGVGTSFHPHFGTYVEKPWEIDELLRRTEIGLCLDTGHFHVGGADPVEWLRRWAHRINHIHLKDVRQQVLDEARRRGDEDLEAWWETLCVPLGHGDVDVDGFAAALAEAGYTGWIVIEQDRGPATASAWEQIAADQRANRDWLASRLPS